jgi:hypothetical protein
MRPHVAIDSADGKLFRKMVTKLKNQQKTIFVTTGRSKSVTPARD